MNEKLWKCHLTENEEVSINVTPTSRLKYDLDSLDIIFEGDILKRAPVKLSKLGYVSYGIGGASRNEFGAAVHVGKKSNFIHGQ